MWSVRGAHRTEVGRRAEDLGALVHEELAVERADDQLVVVRGVVVRVAKHQRVLHHVPAHRQHARLHQRELGHCVCQHSICLHTHAHTHKSVVHS